jgi:hypothetical protein
MKLTIIPIDNAVYIDGLPYINLDLTQSGIPSNIHALQWKDTSGWLEFNNNLDGTKPQNESITSLPEWANIAITKWDEAKTAQEAAIAARQLQPVTSLQDA